MESPQKANRKCLYPLAIPFEYVFKWISLYFKKIICLPVFPFKISFIGFWRIHGFIQYILTIFIYHYLSWALLSASTPSSPNFMSFFLLLFTVVNNPWVQLALPFNTWVSSHPLEHEQLTNSYVSKEEWLFFPRQSLIANSSFVRGGAPGNSSYIIFEWLDFLQVFVFLF